MIAEILSRSFPMDGFLHALQTFGNLEDDINESFSRKRIFEREHLPRIGNCTLKSVLYRRSFLAYLESMQLRKLTMERMIPFQRIEVDAKGS